MAMNTMNGLIPNNNNNFLLNTNNTNNTATNSNNVSVAAVPAANINMNALPPITALPLPTTIPIASADDPQLASLLNSATATLPILPVLITPNNSITNLAAALPPIQSVGLQQNLLPSLSTPNLRQLGTPSASAETVNTNNLKQEIAKKDQQMQLIQSAYWQLQSDFDNACNLIKQQQQQQQQQGDNGNGNNNGSKLDTISEEDEESANSAEFKQILQSKDEEIDALKQENEDLLVELSETRKSHSKHLTDLKQKNREINKENNGLKRHIKSLKMEVKGLEKQNKRLCSMNYEKNNKQKVEKDILKELYLNSNAIKKFMNGIKKYGQQYQTLKKRQANLTKCIGKEDNETFKIRMDDLYNDIIKAEQSYKVLYESLDIIKTESQGKEFEAMTRSKETIGRLEQEVQSKSMHLEEYVKKNQSLQTDLTDREMKLRQARNEVDFIKQKLNRIQNENDNLMDQLNNVYNNNNNQNNNNMNNNNVNNMNTMNNNNFINNQQPPQLFINNMPNLNTMNNINFGFNNFRQ